MITFRQSGNFNNLERFFDRVNQSNPMPILNKYGQLGVVALSSATPKDTGKTASSWSYEIVKKRGGYSIIWKNEHEINGVSLAILLQYGHGTRNGGYVEGRDFINPAIVPIFDQISIALWEEVSKI